MSKAKQRTVSQCDHCQHNDDDRRCKKNHLEFYNGRKCNDQLLKYMNRVRIITHPTRDISMLYSDMERV